MAHFRQQMRYLLLGRNNDKFAFVSEPLRLPIRITWQLEDSCVCCCKVIHVIIHRRSVIKASSWFLKLILQGLMVESSKGDWDDRSYTISRGGALMKDCCILLVLYLLFLFNRLYDCRELRSNRRKTIDSQL